ncbi:MAG: ATP-dependent zinc metalloprotease FtsH [Bacteroidales bacterium]|nr:ATP-dependent zinc metalloprotease FtsH [Bacteroidales bacterium]
MDARRDGNGGFRLSGLLWATLFLILLNNFIAPLLTHKRIIDTDYGAFVSKVQADSVKRVVIQDKQILYETEDQTYRTGTVNDPNLVERLLSAGSPNKDGRIAFVQEVQAERSPLVDIFVWWVLPGLIFWLIYRSFIKRMAARAGQPGGGIGMGNFMSLGQSGAKVYAENDIQTRFSDVAGQDEAKASLQEMVDFLHNPQKYASLGAKLPKGALLVGPPGTGKTLIARAVAGEAHVPFFSMSGSEFVQMFVGMGAAKVRDLFDQAEKKAPCIIFIDEIDAIGKSRENQFSTNDEREQTLNQLLTEMDGFEGEKCVIILAATNRPDSLDKALLRPGRFDRRIQMELPDLEGRKAIVQVHLAKVRHADIDLDVIGRATAGSSGADLANIVNEAALRAVRLGKTAVTTEDIEESVETVMAGEQRRNAVISSEEKRIIAYHEVGHAMVAAVQNNSAPVHKITIVPRTSGALGYTMQVDEGEKFLYSKEYLLNKIATLTGGRVAEELICDTCTTGASNDIEQATRLARGMVTRYGMSDRYGMMALETGGNTYLGGASSLACSAETAAAIDEEVRTLIGDAKRKATEIISANMAAMHAVAEYLLEKETITGEEFTDILHRTASSSVTE